jgi:hypothetical protein
VASPHLPGSHPRPALIGSIVYLLFGLIVWSIHLTVIYGGHTLLCTGGLSSDWSTRLIVGATVLAALATAAALLAQDRLAAILGLSRESSGRGTLVSIARLLNVLALVAIVWSGGTAAVLEACAPAR